MILQLRRLWTRWLGGCRLGRSSRESATRAHFGRPRRAQGSASEGMAGVLAARAARAKCLEGQNYPASGESPPLTHTHESSPASWGRITGVGARGGGAVDGVADTEDG